MNNISINAVLLAALLAAALARPEPPPPNGGYPGRRGGDRQRNDHHHDDGHDRTNGYKQDGGFQDDQGYQSDGGSQDNQGYQNDGGFQNDQGYQDDGGYQKDQGYQKNGGSQGGQGFGKFGGFQDNHNDDHHGQQKNGGYQGYGHSFQDKDEQNALGEQDGNFQGHQKDSGFQQHMGDHSNGMTAYEAHPLGTPRIKQQSRYLPPTMSTFRPSSEYGAPFAAGPSGPSTSSGPARRRHPGKKVASLQGGRPAGSAGHPSGRASGQPADRGAKKHMRVAPSKAGHAPGHASGQRSAGQGAYPGAGDAAGHDAELFSGQETGSFVGRGFAGSAPYPASGHGSAPYPASGHGSAPYPASGHGSDAFHKAGAFPGSDGVGDMYGPPGRGHTRGGLGHRGRDGDQDDDMMENAMYHFEYSVGDNASPEAGADAPQFGQHEERDGEVTRGTYRVLLPDGRLQRVDYEADERGFRPTVSFEEAGAGRKAGGSGPY